MEDPFKAKESYLQSEKAEGVILIIQSDARRVLDQWESVLCTGVVVFPHRSQQCDLTKVSLG